MISDEDQISDTDSEPASPQVEKRQYHNLLERNRRNVLKYSFWKLRCAVPSLAKKNVRMNEKKASRAKILKRAIDYINRDELKRAACLKDIKDLQREQIYLEEQYAAMIKAEKEGDYERLDAIGKSIEELQKKVYEEEVEDTEDDDEDSDDAGNAPDEAGEASDEQPQMNWQSDNEDETVEAEKNWSGSGSESDSSESEETSEESSSDSD